MFAAILDFHRMIVPISLVEYLFALLRHGGRWFWRWLGEGKALTAGPGRISLGQRAITDGRRQAARAIFAPWPPVSLVNSLTLRFPFGILQQSSGDGK
jgi:hypothetical protein